MKNCFFLLTIFFPWYLRRKVLNFFFQFKIHHSAKIGFSFVFPKYLEMGPHSTIDHFCVAVNLDKIILGENSTIGRGNWITGFPTNSKSLHFDFQKSSRESCLIIGNHSAITKNHHLDCTNKISIGDYSTIAGYNSQLLTHSINILENRQDSSPITIGDYCFIGTNVVLLGGSTLPSFCVLGAKSVLNKSFFKEYKLYGGTPAIEIKQIDKKSKYFIRETGFVI